MYNTALRLTGDQHEAEDAVQEGFIKAFRKIHQFRYQGSFGGWLKRIIVNATLDRLRKRPPEYSKLEVAEASFEEKEEVETFPDAARINSEILKLPSGCREILCLYLLEGYSQKEIAACLGISLSTVKTQYRRARMILRDRLTAINDERSV